jgi:acetyl-CoA carboxylase biotin carboxyl carrier protein
VSKDKTSKKQTSPLKIDAAAIKSLAKLVKDTDLSEIEYEADGCRIKVARHITAAHFQVPTVAPSPTPAATPEVAAPVKSDPANHPGAVKSPMVGTAYSSPQPGSEPFVKAGSKVKQGETVMIVEAMKVMNQIRAHKSGTISEILIQDGTPVEYDDVLMLIE